MKILTLKQLQITFFLDDYKTSPEITSFLDDYKTSPSAWVEEMMIRVYDMDIFELK